MAPSPSLFAELFLKILAVLNHAYQYIISQRYYFQLGQSFGLFLFILGIIGLALQPTKQVMTEHPKAQQPQAKGGNAGNQQSKVSKTVAKRQRRKGRKMIAKNQQLQATVEDSDSQHPQVKEKNTESQQSQALEENAEPRQSQVTESTENQQSEATEENAESRPSQVTEEYTEGQQSQTTEADMKSQQFQAMRKDTEGQQSHGTEEHTQNQQSQVTEEDTEALLYDDEDGYVALPSTEKLIGFIRCLENANRIAHIVARLARDCNHIVFQNHGRLDDVKQVTVSHTLQLAAQAATIKKLECQISNLKRRVRLLSRSDQNQRNADT